MIRLRSLLALALLWTLAGAAVAASPSVLPYGATITGGAFTVRTGTNAATLNGARFITSTDAVSVASGNTNWLSVTASGSTQQVSPTARATQALVRAESSMSTTGGTFTGAVNLGTNLLYLTRIEGNESPLLISIGGATVAEIPDDNPAEFPQGLLITNWITGSRGIRIGTNLIFDASGLVLSNQTGGAWIALNNDQEMQISAEAGIQLYGPEMRFMSGHGSVGFVGKGTSLSNITGRSFTFTNAPSVGSTVSSDGTNLWFAAAGASASAWSGYAATSTVNLATNAITGLSSVTWAVTNGQAIEMVGTNILRIIYTSGGNPTNELRRFGSTSFLWALP